MPRWLGGTSAPSISGSASSSWATHTARLGSGCPTVPGRGLLGALKEITGEHFSRFYPREAQESKWPDRELEIAANGGRFADEGLRVRKDGTTFWANVVITAFALTIYYRVFIGERPMPLSDFVMRLELDVHVDARRRPLPGR